jgi:hypothetical protein
MPHASAFGGPEYKGVGVGESERLFGRERARELPIYEETYKETYKETYEEPYGKLSVHASHCTEGATRRRS